VGLRAVLVDEGRARRPVRQPVKVDGTSITNRATSEWVRIRIDLGSGTEERPAGQPARTRRTPQLMCLPTLEGRCPFQPTDTIDVRSEQFGEFVVKVAGEAVPIRKKRRVIGWEVPLERVKEQTPMTGPVA
jgi:hypothetical protein